MFIMNLHLYLKAHCGFVLYSFCKRKTGKRKKQERKKRKKGRQDEGLAFHFSKTGNNGATTREQANVFLPIIISPQSIRNIERLQIIYTLRFVTSIS